MTTGEMYPTGPGGDLYAPREREVGFGEMFKVLWSPVDVLRRAAHNNQVLLGFASVSLVAALGLISSLIQVASGTVANQFNTPEFRQLPPEIQEGISNAVSVGGPIGAVLQPFILWILISGLVYLAARILGGRGAFTAMLAIVGLSFLPSALGTLVSTPIAIITGAVNPTSGAGLAGLMGVGLIGALIAFAVFIWQIALVIIGTRFAQNMDSYGHSAGACALSCGGCVGVCVLFIVGLVALVALLGGA